MAESIIKPKKPNGSWKPALWWQAPPKLKALGYPVSAWENKKLKLFALSAVEVTDKEPRELDVGPEYHLSVSAYGKRCSVEKALIALKDFGLEDAIEDNHVPSGFVRNFWRPVADRYSGHECPCVDNEPAIKEDKGDFIWRGLTK